MLGEGHSPCGLRHVLPQRERWLIEGQHPARVKVSEASDTGNTFPLLRYGPVEQPMITPEAMHLMPLPLPRPWGSEWSSRQPGNETRPSPAPPWAAGSHGHSTKVLPSSGTRTPAHRAGHDKGGELGGLCRLLITLAPTPRSSPDTSELGRAGGQEAHGEPSPWIQDGGLSTRPAQPRGCPPQDSLLNLSEPWGLLGSGVQSPVLSSLSVDLVEEMSSYKGLSGLSGLGLPHSAGWQLPALDPGSQPALFPGEVPRCAHGPGSRLG